MHLSSLDVRALTCALLRQIPAPGMHASPHLLNFFSLTVALMSTSRRSGRRGSSALSSTSRKSESRERSCTWWGVWVDKECRLASRL